jgi:hypothetical protein
MFQGISCPAKNGTTTSPPNAYSEGTYSFSRVKDLRFRV